MQLIHILRTLKVPPNAYLIMLNIKNVYTNISHEEVITAFLKRQKHNPHKVLVLDLVKYVLKIMYFNLINRCLHNYMGLQWELSSLRP